MTETWARRATADGRNRASERISGLGLSRLCRWDGVDQFPGRVGANSSLLWP